MKQGQLDETLAFTALFERDPEYRSLTSGEATDRRNALLGAWYAQDEIKNMWKFAEKWLADERATIERIRAAGTGR